MEQLTKLVNVELYPISDWLDYNGFRKSSKTLCRLKLLRLTDHVMKQKEYTDFVTEVAFEFPLLAELVIEPLSIKDKWGGFSTQTRGAPTRGYRCDTHCYRPCP